MPTVNDIYNYLNEMVPFENKCSWDNCGILIGNSNAEVKKIGFTLDLTSDTLKKAKNENVDLIITHHPVIFRPQKSFLEGNIAYDTAISGISVISAHTCYDCAEQGVSYILAKVLGLDNITEVKTEENPSCVRIGEISNPDLSDGKTFAKYVSDKLDTTVRLADGDRKIIKVAVCGGSGGDFIYDAVKEGADAYVTGDLSHHHFLAAKETGMTIIAAGHFETENPAIKPLMNKVCSNFATIEGVYLEQKNPVEFIR